MPVWSQTTLDPTHTRASTPETAGKIVLDRTLFEGRYQSLSDFFATLSGIQTMPTGGLGDPVLVSIQGATSKQTTLQINGIKVNSSQYGSYNLNAIPIHQIEEIHITTSGSHDDISSAIGGTINIITKSNDQTAANISYGSFNTYSVEGSLQSANGMLFHSRHLSSDNSYTYPVPISSNGTQNQYEPLRNSEFKENSFRVSANHFNIDWSVSGETSKKNIPDYFRNSPQNDASLKQEGFNIHLSKSFEGSKEDWFHKTSVSYIDKYEHYQDLKSTIGLDENDDEYHTRQTSAQLSSEKKFDHWSTMIQTDYEVQSFRSIYNADEDSYLCTTPNGSCDITTHQNELSLSGSFTRAPSQNEVEFTQQVFATLSQNNTKQRNGANSESSTSHFWGYLSQISKSFPNSQHSLSLSRKTRLPSLYERFGDRGLVLSNEDLQAETSTTVTLKNVWNSFLDASVKIELFYRKLENAIIPIYDARGIGRYENTNKADVSGLEWAWKLRDQDGFSFHLAGSHYDSKNKSTDVLSFNGKQLAGLYHHTVKSNINYQKDKHSFDFQYEYATSIYKDHSNLNKLDDKSIASAYYQYTMINTQFGLRAINLLNSEFIDASGRPSIGRNFTAFLQHQF